MAVVNRFNVNKQQVTLDADIIENMSANDVSYNSSLQYGENTVGDKLSKLEQELEQRQTQSGVYDVSAHNNGVVFESLQSLLSSSNLSTLIPESVRQGGMSIQFIQSSDNKYVQYRLTNQSWSVDVNDWTSGSGGEFSTGENVSEIGIDDEPTDISDNLVKSGGVKKQINNFAKSFAIFGMEETVSYGESTYSGGFAGLYSAFPINKNGKYLTAIECKLSPSDSNLYLIKVSNETIISFIKIEWTSIGIELVDSVHKYDLSALMKIGSEGDYIAINRMSYIGNSRPSDLLAFSDISIGKTNDSTVYTPFANIYFANIENSKVIIGDISDLDTENKTSIVNAINETLKGISGYFSSPVNYPYNIDVTPNISGGYVFAFPIKTAGLLKSITAKFSSDSGRIGIGKVNGTRLSIIENLNITPIVGEKRVYDLTSLNKIVDLTDYIVIQWLHFINSSAPSSCDAVGCQTWGGAINSPALFTPYFQYDIIPESKIKDEFLRVSNVVEQIESDITTLDDKVDVLERKTTLNRGIYCLGDSTTAGWGSEYSSIDGIVRGAWSWADILNTKIQFKEYNKLAVSGAVAMKDTRTGFTGKPALMLQVNKVPKNYTGIITVMIGTNDIVDGAPLGDVDYILTMQFSELKDEISFAESYRLCMETLSRNSPEAIILAMMPVSPKNGENYIGIEKKICNALSIPVINTRNECGLNSLCNSEYFFADILHPNENGYRRIAEYMYKTISPYVGTTNEVVLSGSVKDSSDVVITNLRLEFKTPQPNSSSIIYSINTNSEGNFRLLVPKATYSIKCNSEYTLDTTEITIMNDTVVNLIATAI